MVMSLLFFLPDLFGDPTHSGKVEDTKISVVNDMHTNSDLSQVCFAGYHFTKTDL